jgi:hypothetical protein
LTCVDLKAGDTEGAKQLIRDNITNIHEDIAALEEADKTAFPFIVPLVETIPQLAVS